MTQESKEVQLTIDGQEVVAQEGMSVHDTALANDIFTPHAPANARIYGFSEVEEVVAADAAECEARRCLRCDLEFTKPAEESSDIARAGDLR
jgi:predicted molibdopterin-dependent oxidoreductase YjgC